MKKRLLLVGGVILLLVGLFGLPQQANVNGFEIDVPKPNGNVPDNVRNIASLVTNVEDRQQLCAFNKIFADRLISYETDQQKLNDVYVLAAKKYFGDSLKDKYKDLDVILKNAISSVTGDDVHLLGDKEKEDLQNNFYAISWYLIN